uniref:Uncharacterized protein n=1 Tax=Rhizophora mucronata TaxID=61149 RepID=A0A2P2QV28_RHIMU
MKIQSDIPSFMQINFPAQICSSFQSFLKPCRIKGSYVLTQI